MYMLQYIHNNANKNNNRTEMDKSATISPKNDVIVAKSAENATGNDDDTKLYRTLQLATNSVIVIKRITIPVTLELRPTHGSSNLNVARAHRNIFISMKMKDPTLKLIANDSVIDIEL